MLRRVLVIEDNNEDFESLLRSLGDQASALLIARSMDGDEALDLLRARSLLRRSDQLPEVIVLDLNMPGTDGREILAELKADECLKVIPVVVLSTSSDPNDVRSCYRMGASAYCFKSLDRPSFDRMIAAMSAFWFKAVALPQFVSSP